MPCLPKLGCELRPRDLGHRRVLRAGRSDSDSSELTISLMAASCLIGDAARYLGSVNGKHFQQKGGPLAYLFGVVAFRRAKHDRTRKYPVRIVATTSIDVIAAAEGDPDVSAALTSRAIVFTISEIGEPAYLIGDRKPHKIVVQTDYRGDSSAGSESP